MSAGIASHSPLSRTQTLGNGDSPENYTGSGPPQWELVGENIGSKTWGLNNGYVLFNWRDIGIAD